MADNNILTQADYDLITAAIKEGGKVWENAKIDPIKNKVKEIECEANTVVIFPNTFEHTGTTHTDKPFRYVLNLNYFS